MRLYLHCHYRGFTLIELLIGMLIVSILLCSVISIYPIFYAKSAMRQREVDIKRAIHFAKNIAYFKNRTLIIQPLAVSKDWSDGIVVLTIDNQILYKWRWRKSNIYTTWHGFQANNRIVFTAKMNRNASNGYFLIADNFGNKCKLILNRFGRVRKE